MVLYTRGEHNMY